MCVCMGISFVDLLVYVRIGISFSQFVCVFFCCVCVCENLEQNWILNVPLCMYLWWSFMYLVFTPMAGGVSVGDSRLSLCPMSVECF